MKTNIKDKIQIAVLEIIQRFLIKVIEALPN